MKYYKNEAGEVFAFSSDGSQDAFIGEDLKALSPSEIDDVLNPQADKTIQQQIEELENSVTKRNYREFVMGNQVSIKKINEVDAAIELLRAEL